MLPTLCDKKVAGWELLSPPEKYHFHSFASHTSLVAVLVAISIPIFTSQLEKSREATDAANIRSAYAEIMSDAVMGDPVSEDKTTGNVTIKATQGSEGSYIYSATIKLEQKQDGWQKTDIDAIGGYDVTSLSVGSGKTVTITYTQSTSTLAMTAA